MPALRSPSPQRWPALLISGAGIYAREGVAHAWLVDPLRQSLEVLALESGGLRQIEVHHGNSSVRARPFDAIELELLALWS
jgi:hypothetical protein